MVFTTEMSPFKRPVLMRGSVWWEKTMWAPSGDQSHPVTVKSPSVTWWACS